MNNAYHFLGLNNHTSSYQYSVLINYLKFQANVLKVIKDKSEMISHLFNFRNEFKNGPTDADINIAFLHKFSII